MILENCLSQTGRAIISKLAFSGSIDHIRLQSGRISEFMDILQEGLPFPAQDYLDLIPVFQRIRTPGSCIDIEELIDLRVSLTTIGAAINFLVKKEGGKFPLLKAMASAIEFPSSIIPDTSKILDDKGGIRDNASAELSRIRKDIRAKTTASERIIRSMLVKARENGWTTADAEPTLRDGRMVLPMHASHKRRIRGFVHDESATGQTVYLEPDECYEMNNEVRNLEYAEKRELFRILTQFTDRLRPDLDSLVVAHHFIGEIDAIRAKARFSIKIGASTPILSDRPIIKWTQARHPLLYLAHQEKNKDVVPLDLQLDPEHRILVISGPNAGGKSVCLKSTGLIQYMIQCGLPVPMDSNSEMGIFSQLFLEIGDEQSLEDDLSTYSSHLIHIKHFVQHSDETTLFLIDEFGAGTDPSLGGAIAEAVLEILSEKKAFGIVTTHYSNLKTMAGQVEGIINGAMIFDMQEIKPLYQLVTGNPGSSFTYEIANKIGFPEEVIQLAMSKTGKTHLDFEKQLQALEVEKKQLDKKKEEYTVADDFLDELIDSYEKKQSDLEKKKTEILENARKEAQRMLEESNRMIERTIKEIRESAADKEKTRKARADLQSQKEKMEKSHIETGKEELKKVTPKLKKGDWVRLKGQLRTGLILQVKGKETLVDFNGIRFTVRTDELESTRAPENISQKSVKSSGYTGQLQEKTANFKLTLDIRGRKADEALTQVQHYIDDAYLLRIHEVKILHGKGDGILRKVIREMLSRTDEVESFSDEHIEYGGSGITRVIIK